jgi:hypothetical protein
MVQRLGLVEYIDWHPHLFKMDGMLAPNRESGMELVRMEFLRFSRHDVVTMPGGAHGSSTHLSNPGIESLPESVFENSRKLKNSQI